MCGIAGYLTRRPDARAELLLHATTMASAIAHRGPDASGVWCDELRGVALAHRRLAIVDLSPMGQQPMESVCGRYVVVYNGEIYNHGELRKSMPDIPWRGHSDTETLLACLTRWGLQASLERIVGMFAMAIWDRQTQRLFLVRDRMGEKPLYYGWLPSGDFVFGSELKALRAHPRWQAEIDRDALALYMRHNAVPAPHSIYRGIFKLSPGSSLQVSPDGTMSDERYWSTVDAARQARTRPLVLTDAQATDRLETLLGEAVAGQMVADVPLGAFLSGGVDSSAVVALMCRRSSTPVRTFSIGFTEKGYDEALHAKAVARHLGTDHTELYVTPDDAMRVIPRLPEIYDEPFADSSQIPTFLVAQMARRHVAVSLSGDGGDELFAGYNRYLVAERAWRRLHAIPLTVRRSVARAALALSPTAWDRLGTLLSHGVPHLRRHGRIGEKVHKFASSVLPSASQAQMYRALVSHWNDPAGVVNGANEPPTAQDTLDAVDTRFTPVERMCLLDQISYLPDDILVKVDRAAMAVALETRVPLLDHRLVEFAWQLPMHQKIRDGKTKWLLRQVLYRHIPAELIERPKQGFGVPLDHWLRGPLREWAEHLLTPSRLNEDGLLNSAAVRRKWDEHLQGRRNWQFLLWDVLMFQAWHEAVRNAQESARWPGTPMSMSLIGETSTVAPTTMAS
jgi:asparagine synthase (glutamine-hydrolysing)